MNQGGHYIDNFSSHASTESKLRGLVHERTLPTEQPTFVCEASVKFFG
jgi:hypothetical protein